MNGTFWSTIKITLWEILTTQRRRRTECQADPAAQERTRASLSVALDDYLRTGKWRRELSDEEHACLCHRLKCAWRLVVAFQVPYRPMDSPAKSKTIISDPHRDVTEEDVLKWLLIDVWNSISEKLNERIWEEDEDEPAG